MCLEDEVEKIGLGYIFPAFGMEWNVKIDRCFAWIPNELLSFSNGDPIEISSPFEEIFETSPLCLEELNFRVKKLL